MARARLLLGEGLMLTWYLLGCLGSPTGASDTAASGGRWPIETWDWTIESSPDCLRVATGFQGVLLHLTEDEFRVDAALTWQDGGRVPLALHCRPALDGWRCEEVDPEIVPGWAMAIGSDASQRWLWARLRQSDHCLHALFAEPGR
jgi:hypothetical protein